MKVASKFTNRRFLHFFKTQLHGSSLKTCFLRHGINANAAKIYKIWSSQDKNNTKAYKIPSSKLPVIMIFLQ